MNGLKGKWLVAFIVVILLSGGATAMAHGGDTAKNGKSDNSMAGMDMSGKDHNMDMSGSQKNDSMAGMDMSGKDKNMDMSGTKNDDNMAGMDMGGGPVKETPPNMKILGTFGVVNLLFILMGIWNKWFRRKDGAYVSSK